MNEQIKAALAPCGLNCQKCFAYSKGEIKYSSTILRNALGNFDIYAKRFADLIKEPVFNKYPEFKKLLEYFTEMECQGCRKEKCKLFIDCRVRECHREKGVDFCFQCTAFPCSNTGFDEHLYNRSVAINMRMKEIGVEAYFLENKDKPRYV